MSTASRPTHAVFISYSTKDKKLAGSACRVLEKEGIPCWIAPRDITPGTEWGAAIIAGIDACRIMVLIFSSNANESQQVRREVERAVSKGLTIIPFRVEDCLPEGALEYALSSTHWLDGFTPPLGRQMEILVECVRSLLMHQPGQKPSQVAAPARIRRGLAKLKRSLVVLLGIAMACFAIWVAYQSLGSHLFPTPTVVGHFKAGSVWVGTMSTPGGDDELTLEILSCDKTTFTGKMHWTRNKKLLQTVRINGSVLDAKQISFTWDHEDEEYGTLTRPSNCSGTIYSGKAVEMRGLCQQKGGKYYKNSFLVVLKQNK